MLPLRDTVRAYSFPVINWVLIGFNTLIFLYEVSLPVEVRNELFLSFGLIPARIDLANPLANLTNPGVMISLFSHMFLHGGWFHIISNMWILYIFGDNVEDRMGSGRFLVFYLLSGLAAALTQILVSPDSQIPAIGASGAIAGVLGAYFLLFPRSRVITLIPLFFIPWIVEIPSIFYLGFWFIAQIFSGIAALSQMAQGGVAWFAHVGGFVFGFLFYRLFTPRRHPAYTRQYPDEYWPW